MKYIITGGHSGIGLELTKMLVEEGHKLGLILRSQKKIEAAVKEIGTRENIDFFIADLSDQGQVRQIASEISDKWGYVDGLFNNAGVLLDQPYDSPQGNEMHYEVNTLAPYLLANELQPALSKGSDPFVVSTLTGGLHSRKSLDVDELIKPKKFVKLMGSYLYSKVALLVIMNRLAKQWDDIRIIGVDPGPNKSKMTQGEGMPFWLLPIRNLFFPKPTRGAKFLYDGAFDRKFAGQTGIYITGNNVKEPVIALPDADIEKILAGIKTPAAQ